MRMRLFDWAIKMNYTLQIDMHSVGLCRYGTPLLSPVSCGWRISTSQSGQDRGDGPQMKIFSSSSSRKFGHPLPSATPVCALKLNKSVRNRGQQGDMCSIFESPEILSLCGKLNGKQWFDENQDQVSSNDINEMSLQNVLDEMVSKILQRNITVKRLSLETKVSTPSFPGHLHSLARNNFGENMPVEIKISKYNKNEDNIILNNWENLLDLSDLSTSEEHVVDILFGNSSKDHKLHQNIIGFYLSQKLSKTRLPSDVFHRAKLLLFKQKQKFSPEEEKIILDHVRNGRIDRDVGAILGRSNTAVLNHYNNVMKSKGLKAGAFTISESKLVLEAVFELRPDVLTDKAEVGLEVWQQVGARLNRAPYYVSNHWREILHPIVWRHQAGIVDKDFFPLILQHMLDQNLQFTQVQTVCIAQFNRQFTSRHEASALPVVFQLLRCC